MTGARASLLGLVVGVAACFAADGGTPETVGDARLHAADSNREEWLLYGRSYAQQRYSPLDQIRRANVSALEPVWSFHSGIEATFQTTPLVADGVMYATLPGGHVAALDATTGIEQWRYEHTLVVDRPCCGIANRGAALAYGRVFVATPDAQLIALDRETGEVVWRAELAPPDGMLGASMAPLVFDGKVFAGVTGAGYEGPAEASSLADVIAFHERGGGRGYLAAFEAASGAELWRWYSIPEVGWEGGFVDRDPGGTPLGRDRAAERSRLAQHSDAWRVGGGSIWGTPAVDPVLDLIYFGTGNPSPNWNDEARPGDNLYTSSLVALEAATGTLRWYAQLVPHDLWGYDVASPPLLLNWAVDGSARPAVAQATKSGFLYIHDRATGELLVRSEPFVPQENLFAKPTVDGIRVAPGAAGGASWSPVAYAPDVGLAYVAGLHLPMQYRRSALPGPSAAPRVEIEPLGAERFGTLTAIDTRDGSIRWQTRTEVPLVGGVLATAGGLVFVGEGTGVFAAHDAATGERLWEWRFPFGVNAPPISYAIDGKQYIAVAVGGHKLFGFATGDLLVAFALEH